MLRQRWFSQKLSPLVAGTLILTFTGFVSRLIGFFYRIYLSRMFGEENMGIYQLISPVIVLVFSLSAAGFQNAVSKYVAEKTARHDYKSSLRVWLVGFICSLSTALLCTLFVFYFADFLSSYLLFEKRCAPLLKTVSLSFPFAAVHSCINGYFYGIRKTAVPASSQLAEQLFRVGSVYFLSTYYLHSGHTPNIALAALGMVIGEIGSLLFAAIPACYHFRSIRNPPACFVPKTAGFSALFAQILKFALPLSSNRLCLNLLQAIEAACIPAKLQIFGHSNADALSVYGVLTGMALPLILFPGALTNSISVLLMPAISEADSRKNHQAIRLTVRRCFSCGLLLGGFCCLFFLSTGQSIGLHIFHSKLAGHFIMILSFTCPFLYLNTTLTSILHGLGKTGIPFFLNMFSLLLRLLFVFYAIPVYGIKGYLAGMLLGQIFTTICSLWALRKYLL